MQPAQILTPLELNRRDGTGLRYEWQCRRRWERNTWDGDCRATDPHSECRWVLTVGRER